MSVTLEIYSDHNLNFSSYFEGIDLIEKRLNIKIEDNKSTVEKRKTKEDNETHFFTNHDFLSKKFSENHEIYLFSTFELCQSIIINKHFIRFNFMGRINSKYHVWEKFVSQFNYNELEKVEVEKYNEVLDEWNEVRSFIKNIARKMGGSMIFYLNDGNNFSIVRELILENNKLNLVLDKLNIISKPVEYIDLENGIVGFFKEDNWYFEIL